MDLLQDILDNKFNEPKPHRKYLVERIPQKQVIPKAPVYNLKREITIVEVEPPPPIPTNIKAPRYNLKPLFFTDNDKSVDIIRTVSEPQVYEIPRFNFKLPNSLDKSENLYVSPPFSLNYKIPKFISAEREVPGEKAIVLETISYEIPTRSDLAVLFVFFDYTGSARILINYLYMIEKMKLANIPVFTLELVINGKRPKISDAFHVYASSYLFQKEHLIRLLETRIPETFTKLVCLDADLIYTNPRWYDMLSVGLDSSNVIQPFNYAHWLDITYKNIEKTAIACTYFENKSQGFWSDPTRQYHPGFGWAFTRDWYRTCGLYDLSIVGSGDSIFAYTINKLEFITENIKLYRKTRDDWAAKISDITIGFLDIQIYHLFHGPLAKRQYNARDRPFEQIDDVSTIIEYNTDGVIELTRPDLNQAMFDMWMARDDDGV